MNKLIPLAAVAGLVSVMSANAQLYSSDQYLVGSNPAAGEYTVGPVSGQGPTVLGYTGTYSGDGSVGVTSTGLTYTGLNTAGGALTATPFGRNGRSLSANYDNTFTGTVYLSVLLQFSATNDGQSPSYSAFELFDSGSQRSLQLGASPGDFGTSNFGLRIYGNNDLRMTMGAFDTNVNLFVLKFDLNTTPNADSITVYQNPTNLFVEGANTPIGTITGFDFRFNTLTLADFSGNASNITLDEVRTAGSFQDVLNATPVPEPAHTALAIVGILAVLGVTRKA